MQIFMLEKFLFMDLLLHNPTSRQTTPISLYGSKIGDRLSIYVNGTCVNKRYKLGVHRDLKCGHTLIQTDYSTRSIETPDWKIRMSPKHVFNQISGPKRRIDLKIEKHSSIYSHGIMGYSFSNDVKNQANRISILHQENLQPLQWQKELLKATQPITL